MTTIRDILADKYDVNMKQAPVEAILWAANDAADIIGIEAAKAELHEVNLFREKQGRMVAVPEYGHRLF